MFTEILFINLIIYKYYFYYRFILFFRILLLLFYISIFLFTNINIGQTSKVCTNWFFIWNFIAKNMFLVIIEEKLKYCIKHTKKKNKLLYIKLLHLTNF